MFLKAAFHSDSTPGVTPALPLLKPQTRCYRALTDIDLEEGAEEVKGGRPPLSTSKVLEHSPEHDVHVLGGAAKPLSDEYEVEIILKYL